MSEFGNMNYFAGCLLAQGFANAAAKGICANAIQESSFNPKAVQPGEPGRGLLQWTLGENLSEKTWNSWLKMSTKKAIKAETAYLKAHPSQWINKGYGTWHEFVHNTHHWGPQKMSDAFLISWERAGKPGDRSWGRIANHWHPSKAGGKNGAGNPSTGTKKTHKKGESPDNCPKNHGTSHGKKGKNNTGKGKTPKSLKGSTKWLYYAEKMWEKGKNAHTPYTEEGGQVHFPWSLKDGCDCSTFVWAAVNYAFHKGHMAGRHYNPGYTGTLPAYIHKYGFKNVGKHGPQVGDIAIFYGQPAGDHTAIVTHDKKFIDCNATNNWGKWNSAYECDTKYYRTVQYFRRK